MTITEYISEVTKHMNPDFIGSIEFDINLDWKAQVSDDGANRIRFTFVSNGSKNLSDEGFLEKLGI